MIDQNRDGFIDKEDLHDMLASLGITIILDWMIKCSLYSTFQFYSYKM
jgi:Ca2+-binding EF-hand superfamily protein